jgi:hypothetical protein
VNIIIIVSRLHNFLYISIRRVYFTCIVCIYTYCLYELYCSRERTPTLSAFSLFVEIVRIAKDKRKRKIQFLKEEYT